MTSAPSVIAVARDDAHRFAKPIRESITLVAGYGVDGDAHAGATVQHRSRVARDATAPNLRQVHLIHAELFDEVGGAGFDVAPGDLGENITTVGVDLLALPRGARLRLGAEAVVEVTGLRNPCVQIEGRARGLMKQLVRVADDGTTERLAGIMSVVLVGGIVRPGDPIDVVLPDGVHDPLGPV